MSLVKNTPERRVTDVVRGLAKEVRRDQKILEEVTQSVFMNTRELRTRIKDSVRKLHDLGQRKQNINHVLDRILEGLMEDLTDVQDVLNAFDRKEPDPLGIVLSILTPDFQRRYRLTELINQVRRQVASQEEMMNRQIAMSYQYGGQGMDIQDTINSTVTGMLGPRLDMIRNGLTKRSDELGTIITSLKDSTSGVHDKVNDLIRYINSLLPESSMNQSRGILNEMRTNLFRQMGQLRRFHEQAKMLQMTGGMMLM